MKDRVPQSIQWFPADKARTEIGWQAPTPERAAPMAGMRAVLRGTQPYSPDPLGRHRCPPRRHRCVHCCAGHTPYPRAQFRETSADRTNGAHGKTGLDCVRLVLAAFASAGQTSICAAIIVARMAQRTRIRLRNRVSGDAWVRIPASAFAAPENSPLPTAGLGLAPDIIAGSSGFEAEPVTSVCFYRVSGQKELLRVWRSRPI